MSEYTISIEYDSAAGGAAFEATFAPESAPEHAVIGYGETAQDAVERALANYEIDDSEVVG